MCLLQLQSCPVTGLEPFSFLFTCPLSLSLSSVFHSAAVPAQCVVSLSGLCSPLHYPHNPPQGELSLRSGSSSFCPNREEEATFCRDQTPYHNNSFQRFLSPSEEKRPTERLRESRVYLPAANSGKILGICFPAAIT